MATPAPANYSAASSPVAGGRFVLSDFWRNLSPGWTELTPAGTKPPIGLLAYSGSAWDVKGGKVYFQGGGHADYGGNEVWEWDYENRTTNFVKHYEPDFFDIFGVGTPQQQYAALAPYVDNVNFPGAVVRGGVPTRPITRHTYASLVWLPHLGKFTVAGGSTYSSYEPVTYWDNVWLNSPKDLWLYDPVTKTFDYKGSMHLDSNFRPRPRVALHEGRRKLYSVDANPGNIPQVNSYDPDTNTYRTHPNKAPSAQISDARWVVDTLRDRLVVFLLHTGGVASLWAYDLTTEQWSQINATGTAPGSFYYEDWGVHAEHLDEVWLLSHHTAGMKKLDLQTNTWRTEAISGPKFIQTSGNWFYDRRRKVALLAYQTLGGTQIWAYKGI